jgi:hypothetical protein
MAAQSCVQQHATLRFVFLKSKAAELKNNSALPNHVRRYVLTICRVGARGNLGTGKALEVGSRNKADGSNPSIAIDSIIQFKSPLTRLAAPAGAAEKHQNVPVSINKAIVVRLLILVDPIIKISDFDRI